MVPDNMKWLTKAFDIVTTMLGVVVTYALIVWIFDISATATKLWLLLFLSCMPIVNFLCQRLNLLPLTLSFVKRRDLLPLMRKGFGRQSTGPTGPVSGRDQHHK